jgi:purine-nucleoside phosphorylase
MTGTPHIEAARGDFAELVLMPGDPLRAKALATGYLENPRLVNSVRNMLAYTGTWNGKPVSIMGSGMGMPSISIYAHELFDYYDVQRIVRVGTCGSLQEGMGLGDLVLATAASTDSSMNRQRFNGWDYSAAADPGMIKIVMDAAAHHGIPVRAGEVFATDYFYHPDPEFIERVTDMGILALDMESAALYALARQHRKKALTLLSVTDVISTDEKASTEARQNAFGAVIDVVLSALLDGD